MTKTALRLGQHGGCLAVAGVDCQSALEFTHRFGQPLLARQHGAIVARNTSILGSESGSACQMRFRCTVVAQTCRRHAQQMPRLTLARVGRGDAGGKVPGLAEVAGLDLGAGESKAHDLSRRSSSATQAFRPAAKSWSIHHCSSSAISWPKAGPADAP